MGAPCTLHCLPPPQEGALVQGSSRCSMLKPIKLQEREAQVSGLIRENNSGLKDEEEKLLLVHNSTAPLSEVQSSSTVSFALALLIAFCKEKRNSEIWRCYSTVEGQPGDRYWRC